MLPGQQPFAGVLKNVSFLLVHSFVQLLLGQPLIFVPIFEMAGLLIVTFRVIVHDLYVTYTLLATRNKIPQSYRRYCLIGDSPLYPFNWKANFVTLHEPFIRRFTQHFSGESP